MHDQFAQHNQLGHAVNSQFLFFQRSVGGQDRLVPSVNISTEFKTAASDSAFSPHPSQPITLAKREYEKPNKFNADLDSRRR